MRLALLVLLVLAAAPVQAQGRYLQSAFGGSLSYASTTQELNRYEGDSAEERIRQVSAALEGVVGPVQASLFGGYAGVGRSSLYSYGVEVGLLAQHQHRGAPITLAVSAGLARSSLITDEGVEARSAQALAGSVELARAIPLVTDVELVPAGVAGFSVPLGSADTALDRVFGAALGFSFVATSEVRFVMEPGVTFGGEGLRTYSFSLRILRGR